VSPDSNQSLPVGQCILVTKAPHQVVRRVQVVMDRVEGRLPVGPAGVASGGVSPVGGVPVGSVEARLAAAEEPDYGVLGLGGKVGEEGVALGAEFGFSPPQVTPPTPIETLGVDGYVPDVDIPAPTWGTADHDELVLPPPPPTPEPEPLQEPQGRPGITGDDLKTAIDGLLKGASLTQILQDHDQRPPN
jgi:hypothetical protein